MTMGLRRPAAGRVAIVIGEMADPDSKVYLEKRYTEMLGYYWRMSVRNKRAYKWSRYLAIALGSVVTLVGSLAAFKGLEHYSMLFAILTPILAAALTIIGGFSQSFQWGASWREMVLTAERLQRELDRLHVTPQGELDVRAELGRLNASVITESTGFFDRVMGSSSPAPIPSDSVGGSRRVAGENADAEKPPLPNPT